ncbi:hypothetical protein HDU81_001125 [Chytriomyces hyalinus]|nr:hypothetical protein HDU81_001125 [Chytriomyces hyalinus]
MDTAADTNALIETPPPPKESTRENEPSLFKRKRAFEQVASADEIESANERPSKSIRVGTQDSVGHSELTHTWAASSSLLFSPGGANDSAFSFSSVSGLNAVTETERDLHNEPSAVSLVHQQDAEDEVDEQSEPFENSTNELSVSEENVLEHEEEQQEDEHEQESEDDEEPERVNFHETPLPLITEITPQLTRLADEIWDLVGGPELESAENNSVESILPADYCPVSFRYEYDHSVKLRLSRLLESPTTSFEVYERETQTSKDYTPVSPNVTRNPTTPYSATTLSRVATPMDEFLAVAAQETHLDRLEGVRRVSYGGNVGVAGAGRVESPAILARSHSSSSMGSSRASQIRVVTPVPRRVASFSR